LKGRGSSVVHSRLNGGAHEAVLVDPAAAGELGRADHGPEMIPAAGLVDHLDLGPG